MRNGLQWRVIAWLLGAEYVNNYHHHLLFVEAPRPQLEQHVSHDHAASSTLVKQVAFSHAHHLTHLSRISLLRGCTVLVDRGTDEICFALLMENTRRSAFLNHVS